MPQEYTLDFIYDELKKSQIKISDKYPYIHKTKTKNKSVNLSLGRIWFNLLLPDDFDLINEPVTKPKLDNIIKDIINSYGPQQSSEVLTNIQREAFKLNAYIPNSFNIDSLILSKTFYKLKDQLIKDSPNLTDDEFIKRSNELGIILYNELKDSGLNAIDLMESKTNGGVSDWQALLVSRGMVVDISGNISRCVPGINDKKTIEDFYNTAAQARRNYYVRSTLTAKPGYLARKITMSCANISISENDCKTSHYLEFTPNEKQINNLVGRYQAINNKIELIESESDIKSSSVKLRSPLYCKSPNGICQTCYGTFSKKLNNNNIGILAGGAVNNETINALMKLRHKSSQVDIIKVNFKKILEKYSYNNLINSVCTVTENSIIAKEPISIIIDSNNYSSDTIQEFSDKYIVPGILDVSISSGDTKETIQLPFNFNVNVLKPANIDTSGSITILNYEQDELLIEQKQYLKETNIQIIDRLFEGGIKFITSPAILLDILLSELPSIDLVHLEVIISNMFRSNDNNKIFGRLVDYKNCSIIGVKKLPNIDSWLSSLSFEHINKAVLTGLVQGCSASMNPIERIVVEKYSDE